MQRATGKILKILFLDDLFCDDSSLQNIADTFDVSQDRWLVTGCVHTRDGHVFFNHHKPKYNKDLYLGKNTIGSPSVLAVLNEGHLLFDTNLKWLMDCDYYRRCFDTFGSPKILKEANVAIRLGEHQVTSEITQTIDASERQYMEQKFSPASVSGIDYARKILKKIRNLLCW
jgi:hypothetical protein